MSEPVTICECFARDGLQHETVMLSAADKIALIDAFTEAGFRRIEATSYSHPDRVPAFRDASEVLAGIRRREGVYYKATCPNPRAIRRAVADLEAGRGANELSLLVSATDSHTERNLRTTRAAQWESVAEMVRLAGGRFRLVGVISMALGCAFEGKVDPGVVIADVQRFAALGVELVSIGDTTGLASPTSVRALFRRIFAEVPGVIPVAHFHNTRGTGLANCIAALEAGCRYFDSAFGGVGGHPAADSVRRRIYRQRCHRGFGEPARSRRVRHGTRSGRAARGVPGVRASPRARAAQHGRPIRFWTVGATEPRTCLTYC